MEVTEDLNLFLRDSKISYHIYNSIYRDLQISEKEYFSFLTPEKSVAIVSNIPGYRC